MLITENTFAPVSTRHHVIKRFCVLDTHFVGLGDYSSAHNERKKLKNMLATCARRQRMYRGIRGEAATTAHR
jgi:hypothetical protein